MIYVVDSCSLIKLFNNYRREVFKKLWINFDALVEKEQIKSVTEVFNEIEPYGDALSAWAQQHKNLFQDPTTQETAYIATLFKNSTYQKLIGKDKILQGGPVADPFLIAKVATNDNHHLVSEDGYDQYGNINHKIKIAKICKELKVPCCHLSQFMQLEQWEF